MASVYNYTFKYTAPQAAENTFLYTPARGTVEYTVKSDLTCLVNGTVSITYNDNVSYITIPQHAQGTFRYTFDIPIEVPLGGFVSISLSLDITEYEVSLPQSVKDLTERVGFPRYSPVNSINLKNSNGLILKAFGTYPSREDLNIYVSWEYSTDGVHFKPIVPENTTPVYVKSLRTIPDGYVNVFEDFDDTKSYYAKPYVKLIVHGRDDNVVDRADIIALPPTVLGSAVYAFKLSTLRKLDDFEELPLESGGASASCEYAEEYTLDYKLYQVMFDDISSVVYTELPNCVSGKLFYSNNVAYAYGGENFKNVIMASNPGEFTTPISRIIELPAKDKSEVTAMLAWRDYIIAANPSEMFLISKDGSYFNTKIISTFVGIPKADARCIKATANGLIFKSHNHIYMYYPNIYSSDESVLNLTELSSPIESLVDEYSDTDEFQPFAISTNDAYYLMMPSKDENDYTTKCLKYNYTSKVWVQFEYPVKFVGYNMKSVSDISIYGVNKNKRLAEYLFEKEDLENCLDEPYEAQDNGGKPLYRQESAIPFTIDSGQKANSLNTTSQFVETKFNVATLNDKDTFPMKILVHIDGNTHVTTLDIHTDSAFWKRVDDNKTVTEDLGTLNTLFTLDDSSDIFNTFRQMFLRYSGKGRSIRHIITGRGICPFKIYDINYRFRNLNTKQ